MLMPISSEFVALCRTQIMLLTQGFGASLSVVYLTNELVEAQTRLVPVVAYPDMVVDWERNQGKLMLPASAVSTEGAPWILTDDPAIASLPDDGSELTDVELFPSSNSFDHPPEQMSDENALVNQRQLVLPLVHDEVMLGLLVTQRDDRAWYAWERIQVERIARTLATACVLDQRYQWLQQEQQQEHRLRLQQRDLIDNLLHQFRNSLTALQTFGKLILKRLLPGDASYELASSMSREATRLRELSEQLDQVAGARKSNPLFLPSASDQPTGAVPAKLEQTSIDANAIPLLPTAGFLAGSTLKMERCLVETVLEPLVDSAATIAREKALVIHQTLPDDLPPVWANPQALREVLNNLIENALKYTPAGGHIFVMATAIEEQPWLEISVTDTGPGIPEQDLPRLFERHYRGVQAQGEVPGSGLGLAIARSLVEQMHGTIQVFSPARLDTFNYPELSSSPHGPGTTFVVRLAVAVEEDER